jgi:hypothetical protein
MDNQNQGNQSPESYSNTQTIVPAEPVKPKHGHNLILSYMVLIIFLAAIAGVYSWQHKKVTNLNKQMSDLNAQTVSKSASQPKVITTNTSTTKTWTDNRVYSVSYPSNWTVGEMTGDDATPGSPPTITFTPKGLPALALPIYLNIYTSSDTKSIIDQTIPSSDANSPQSLTVNGFPALYYQDVESSNPAPPEGVQGFTDDFYALTDSSKDITLLFEFQESQKGTNGQAYDATSFVPAYTALVKSTQFLKDEE